MEIIMIRHFQTKGNRQKRYIGVTDESLLSNACLLPRIGELQKQYPLVDQVVVSPLKRCRETAALLFPGQKPVVCSHFRECDFGIFEGKNYEELKDHPDYLAWLESNGTIPFPGGEHPQRFIRRCRAGFEQMVAEAVKERQNRLAMVVHGGTIMAILSGYDSQKRGFYHWQMENGGAFVIRIDEKKWLLEKTYFEEIRKI